MEEPGQPARPGRDRSLDPRRRAEHLYPPGREDERQARQHRDRDDPDGQGPLERAEPGEVTNRRGSKLLPLACCHPGASWDPWPGKARACRIELAERASCRLTGGSRLTPGRKFFSQIAAQPTGTAPISRLLP